MKKLAAAAAAVTLTASLALSSCGVASPAPPASLKVLFIGNSFAVDTMEHVAGIATDLGVEDIKLNVLYIGGCSIRRHHRNLTEDLRIYELFENVGDGWHSSVGKGIKPTIESDDWDVIAIQHGTGDGSRYADEASYDQLPALVQGIRALAPDATVVFNMTWVGEVNSHEEMIAFGNNRKAYYNAVVHRTAETVVPTEGIDIVCPTGTAIQNARAMKLGIPVTRDNYHLSFGFGRYVAALTFVKAITGMDLSGVTWTPTTDPDGNPLIITDEERIAAVRAATDAVNTPFAVTDPHA